MSYLLISDWLAIGEMSLTSLSSPPCLNSEESGITPVPVTGCVSTIELFISEWAVHLEHSDGWP